MAKTPRAEAGKTGGDSGVNCHTAGKKGGRHIHFDMPTPLANLHLTLLDKVGLRLDKFADSNGKVGELFEPLGI